MKVTFDMQLNFKKKKSDIEKLQNFNLSDKQEEKIEKKGNLNKAGEKSLKKRQQF